MTLPATIYVRFSSAEQAQGSSRSRQLTLCREMVGRHGWEGAEDRELIDEGVSAFSGANRVSGALLHSFEQQADAGRYRNGHVLVVENLDRISRQGYDAVLPFLQKLTSQGVTVATVDGDRIYMAYERVSMTSVIEAVVKAELSREESEKKSIRIKAAQNKRVKKAQENAGQHISHTATVPAWIDVTRTSKLSERPEYAMTLNQERATVLREIFQLTIDGFGTPAIARRLNERGERVWSHLNKQSANGWTVGYLTKLVMSRAVMGEYYPMNQPRGGQPTSKGVAILDHFPQAIDPVMFAKAQAARQGRRGTSGSWQKTHNNLFSGIATCRSCGGRMKQEMVVREGGARRNGKNRHAIYQSRQQISYLKCHNALNRVHDEQHGRPRCDNRNWVRYEKVEAAVVEFAAGWVAANRQSSTSAAVEALEIKVADARRFLADKQAQADNAAISFTRTGSATMERLMLQLEVEALEMSKAIQGIEAELECARLNAPSPHLLDQIEEQRRGINSQDADERARARVAIKQMLHGLISSMECTETRHTMIVLGDRAMGLVFNNDGELVQSAVLQHTVHGPHGEIDWHPDHPDADYEYAVAD